MFYFRVWKKWCVLLCAVLTLLLVVSCGGGGGGGGGDDDDDGGGEAGITYSGQTTQATITQDNVRELVVRSYLGHTAGSAGVEMDEAQAGDQEGQSEATGAWPEYLGQAELVKSLGLQIAGPATNQPDLAADKKDTVIVDGECGGTATAQRTIDRDAGRISGTVTYSAYCNNGVTINGQAEFHSKYDTATGETIWFKLTYQGTTFTIAKRSYGYEGDILYNYATTRIQADYKFKDLASGLVYWLRDLLIVYTFDTDETHFWANISGRTYLPRLGFVDFSTPSHLEYYSYYDNPVCGVYQVEGAGGTSAWITFLDAYTYQVDADLNGDGNSDWDSGVQNW